MEQEVGTYNVHVTVDEPNGTERAYNARSLIVMAVTADEKGDMYVAGNTIFDKNNPTDIVSLYTVMQEISQKLRDDFPKLDKVYKDLKEQAGVECVEVKYE